MWIWKKNTGFGFRKALTQTLLNHLTAVGQSTSPLTCPAFSFLLCKMKLMTLTSTKIFLGLNELIYLCLVTNDNAKDSNR